MGGKSERPCGLTRVRQAFIAMRRGANSNFHVFHCLSRNLAFSDCAFHLYVVRAVRVAPVPLLYVMWPHDVSSLTVALWYIGESR